MNDTTTVMVGGRVEILLENGARLVEALKIVAAKRAAAAVEIPPPSSRPSRIITRTDLEAFAAPPRLRCAVCRGSGTVDHVTIRGERIPLSCACRSGR